MFGLLGKRLSHSFSKEIHESFGGSYALFETDDLRKFFKTTNFQGLNVTIPYKQDVIDFCDVIDPTVRRTNSCNTIVRKDDSLYAYNTDYDGFLSSLKEHHISFKDETIALIGNGATSRTIQAVANDLNAGKVSIFARHPKPGEYALHTLEGHKDISILVNATPVGMYPNVEEHFSFDIKNIDALHTVIDVIYNPLRSRLLLAAKEQNLQTMNGLYMLVSQAATSHALFHQKKLSKKDIDSLYRKLRKKHSNIVFIGMPKSGKSLYSKIYANKHGKAHYDTDTMFEKRMNMSISEYFASYDESLFRKEETLILKELSPRKGIVISTGGGVILSKENIRALKQNGVLVFIDAPLPLLKRTRDSSARPLLKDHKALDELYRQRHRLYLSAVDIVLEKKSLDTQTTINALEVLIHEYFGA